MADKKKPDKIKVGFGQAMAMLGPYAKEKILEQIKSVAVIILYLIFFQTVVLGIPIANATTIAVGLSLVIVGLAFFMEGLFLGLMPLGEVIGIKLPQKSALPVILIFSFILGFGATFAEPAIGVLKAAGSAVLPWEAPLLFVILNKYSDILVYSVGGGVGFAVIFGMLRFLYGWSLKPFLYILVTGLSALTLFGVFFSENMLHLTGLAWDCGAVTTGPVTVPLVLALGIGISRIASAGGDGGGGFGVVTLASLFPILTVLLLGFFFLNSHHVTGAPAIPEPLKATELFNAQNREAAVGLFQNEAEMQAFALKESNYNQEGGKVQPLSALFDGDNEKILAYINQLKADKTTQKNLLGSEDGLDRWAALKGTEEIRLAVFGTPEAVLAAAQKYASSATPTKPIPDILNEATIGAVRAILPLTIFLMFFLVVILREKLPRFDEVMLGVLFALLGMGIFNIGIELGLTSLGGQVGGKLPASFTAIEQPEQKKTIQNFNEELVRTAVTEDGKQERFFFTKEGNHYLSIPYHPKDFDESTSQYSYIPTIGPLFGGDKSFAGILVVLLFAFIMGYGATLAEPALNALGLTVEEITVGTFKKVLLMQAVALGVGVGIMLGVAKIIYGWPLIYMLAPPYMLLLIISYLSTDEFVNIGWDSAGVTTGPITVPLVLAMGLGIGGEVGVVEGFGILSMASVCPILSVLLVGLNVTRRRRAALESAVKKDEKQVAAV